MKITHRARLFQSVFLFVLGITVVVCAFAMFRTVPASKSALRSTEANHTHTLPVSIPPPAEQLEAELITILPSGFQPTEITRPAGKFLLAIENRSGLQSIDFNLRAESGTRLFQVSRTWERPDWTEVVNPPPGRYVLGEANHPTWQCVITITP
jgi:hypothetical protein